jgi:GTP-binding protein
VRYLTKFLTSAADPRHFPPPVTPEIAFVGRSNVGKSSLINALLGEKVAKTSSTPGRTRTINFFAVRRQGAPKPEVVFSDLPGYGYAKLPKEMTAEWPSFIEPYLKARENLALILVLVDTNIPPQERDKQLVEWLRHFNRPFLVVGTKADRVSGNTLRTNMQTLVQELRVERIVAFSKLGPGKEEVWKEIRAAADRFTGTAARTPAVNSTELDG